MAAATTTTSTDAGRRQRVLTAATPLNASMAPSRTRSIAEIPIPSGFVVYERASFGGDPTRDVVASIQKKFDQKLITSLNESLAGADAAATDAPPQSRFEFRDVIPWIRESAQSMVNDSFTVCFREAPYKPWNFNPYLWPTWALGVVLRYGVLFPLRLICLLFGTLLFAVLFFLASTFLLGERRARAQRTCIQFYAKVFVASWSGVVRSHGVRPSRGPNQVFVANHTTVLDIAILFQDQTYAVVGQRHTGALGLLQRHVLACLGCVWFERAEAKDRAIVVQKIREHIRKPENNPLLIFPEGTCVNNEYCCMFKKGAFELGDDVTVQPVAIKYNKLFADMFWNSRKQSFPRHLFNLMTSWAVVADVWYLEPARPQPLPTGGMEDPIAFANRVKDAICRKAHLVNVPWDGFLKYVQPSEKFLQYRQRIFASRLSRVAEAAGVTSTAAAAASTAATDSGGDDADKAGRPRRR